MDAKGRPTSADLPYEVLFRAIAKAQAAKPGDPARYQWGLDALPGKIVRRKLERLVDWSVVVDGGHGIHDESMWRLPVQHERLRETFRAILAEVGPPPTPEEWTSYNNARAARREADQAERAARVKAGRMTVLDALVVYEDAIVEAFERHLNDYLLNGAPGPHPVHDPAPATGYADDYLETPAHASQTTTVGQGRPAPGARLDQSWVVTDSVDRLFKRTWS